MSLNGKLKSDLMVELISAACCKSVLSKIGGYRSMLMDILFMFPGNYCASEKCYKQIDFYFIISMPTGFSICGYMYPITFIFGVHPNFSGCNVPSNSSFGDTKKMNCIFFHFTCPVFVYGVNQPPTFPQVF